MRALLILLTLFFVTACDDTSIQHSETTFSGQTMGTTFMVKVVDLPDSTAPEDIKEGIDQVLKDVNNKMSLWIESSELVQLNASTSTDWQPVSGDLFNVLAKAEEISKLSNGKFDVTLEPLIKIWGFSKDKRSHDNPSDETLQKILLDIGYQKIKLDLSKSLFKKEVPHLKINLSAIAKGFGIDQVARFLESKGVGHYMVEIGGDLRVKGSNAREQAWKIGIETPKAESREIHNVIAVETAGMATSGDYRNYFEKDGKRFSHIIDPATARPITHKLASVTVLSDDAMTADALATTLLVMGPEKGFELAQAHDIAAFFLVREGDGFKEMKTSHFHSFVKTVN